MPLNRTESIMMRVSPAVDARIRAAARDAGISVNELMNRAVMEWLLTARVVVEKVPTPEESRAPLPMDVTPS